MGGGATKFAFSRITQVPPDRIAKRYQGVSYSGHTSRQVLHMARSVSWVNDQPPDRMLAVVLYLIAAEPVTPRRKARIAGHPQQ